MAKAVPLCDKINEAFVQFCIFHLYLNVDESMVLYFNSHIWKVFAANQSELV